MTEAVWALAKARYEKKEALLPDPAILHRVERDIMLQIVDAQWKDHLYSLDHLKEGIGLRGYGQRDPLVEYQEGELRPLPADARSRRGGDGPLSVAADANDWR